MRARVAWLLLACTVVLIVADIAVTARYESLLSEFSVAVHGFPFVEAAVVGSSLMGAVIISRYDRHVIGWLLATVGIASAVSLFAEAYGVWVVQHDGPGSPAVGGVSGWLSQAVGGQLSIGLLALMFLLAPDGHLLSRGWRYAAWAVVLGMLACTVGVFTLDPRTYDFSDRDASLLTHMLLSGGFFVIAFGLIASLVSMVRRLRRSEGEEKHQVRLIAVSAALLTLGLVDLFVVQLLNGGHQSYLASLPLFISYALLPILLAVAVLKYRLYDVQVIINRTVLLAVGTAFAAIFYTLLVVVVGRLVGTRTSGFWLSLLGTAVVAVAFQPLRRHAVRLANRLAFGARAKPYEALAHFSERLGETPVQATLLPAVAEAAARAVSARGSRVTLDLPGGSTEPWTDASTATWGDDVGEEPHVVLVRHGGHTLGRIEVALPQGRDLRKADQRLLEAMADQAAVAFRNAAMGTQLAAHVAELDRTTQELARSRSRIIEADDAARRMLEAAISRDVMPHLVGLPEEVRRSGAAVSAGDPDNGLDGLIAGTNTALEALRELSRGVFPTQLARSGLEPALRSQLSRNGPGATLEVDPSASGRRFSPRVESAVYFCCAEAASALSSRSSIRLAVMERTLLLRIDHVGLTDMDLQGVLDRVEAVQGTLTTQDEALILRIPVDADPTALSSVEGAGRGSDRPHL